RGWPIVGDPAYGEPRWEQVADPLLAATLRAFPRQALHAWRVAFVHPITRARLELEAPVPPDMGALMAACGLPGPKGPGLRASGGGASCGGGHPRILR
ncbi:MAG TPA: hypothetical protein VKI43_17930, partial [Vicinamibacterales bacterium]|nr:hypothetical protein [Vicinamibacterales bacterium]